MLNNVESELGEGAGGTGGIATTCSKMRVETKGSAVAAPGFPTPPSAGDGKSSTIVLG